jgi:hypothetical protein
MKMIKSLAAVLVVIALSSFTMTATTYPPGKACHPAAWHYIGDKWADYGVDRDVLVVTGNDIYSKIKIKITDAPLHIMDMDIVFENGEQINVPLKNRFRQGQESRVIDLPGANRRLKRIELVYSTVGRARGKARIALWGFR